MPERNFQHFQKTIGGMSYWFHVGTSVTVTDVLGYCHGHEGMNYVTRPWASDKGNTRQFTNYVTRSWASDEGDHRTYEEEQSQTSISHHSPRGEYQIQTSRVAKELHHSPMGE